MKKLLFFVCISIQIQGTTQKLDRGTVFDFRSRVFPRQITDLGSDRLLVSASMSTQNFTMVNGEKSNGLVLTDYSGALIDPLFGSDVVDGTIGRVKARFGFVLVETYPAGRSASRLYVLNLAGEKVIDSESFTNEDNSPFTVWSSVNDFDVDKDGNVYFSTYIHPGYKIYRADTNGNVSEVTTGDDYGYGITFQVNKAADILVTGQSFIRLIGFDGIQKFEVDLPGNWLVVLNFDEAIELTKGTLESGYPSSHYYKYRLDGSLEHTFTFEKGFNYDFQIYDGENVIINGPNSLQAYSLKTGKKTGEFANYSNHECYTGVALENGGVAFAGEFGYVDGSFSPGIAFLDSSKKIIRNELKLQAETHPHFMIRVGDKLISGGDFYGYGRKNSAGMVVTSLSGTFIKSLPFSSRLTNRVCGMTQWNGGICVSRPCDLGCGEPDIQIYDQELNAIDSLIYSSAGSINSYGDYLIQQGAWKVDETWYPLAKISSQKEKTFAFASYMNSTPATKQVLAIKDDLIYRVGRSPEGIHALCINSLDFSDERKISFTNKSEYSGNIIEVTDGVVLSVGHQLFKVKGFEIDPEFKSPVFTGDVYKGITALASDGDVIYVGHTFDFVDGVSFPGVVAVSSATGEVIDSLLFPLHHGSVVRNIFVFGTDIYLGGDLILDDGSEIKFARFSTDPHFVDSEIVESPLGLLEMGVTIYPNPTHGEFFIKMKNPSPGTFQIFTVGGDEVLRGELRDQPIQLPGPSGLYVLRLRLADGTRKELKIVKSL